MTSKVRTGVRGFLAFSTALMLATACGGDKPSSKNTDLEADAGLAALGCAIDEDGDGYGLGCPDGEDCNDADKEVHNDCPPCMFPDEGCKCEDEAPIACEEASLPHEDTLLCASGMRYCRDGKWTGCE